MMPPPPSVTFVTVAPERTTEVAEFPGAIEPYRRVEVRSPVAGIIVSQPIPEGAPVHAGQLLFQIDTTIYAATLRGAQARLGEAQARLDNADRNVARLNPLLAIHAVAQRDADDAVAEQAQARAAVEDARSAVDRARKDLVDAAVKAEIDGRVGQANLMLGARVTGPADLLTTIDVLDPVRVTFRPSTQQLLAWHRDPRANRALQPGGSARIAVLLADGTEYPAPGKLDYISPAVDSGTGTATYRAVVANPNGVLVPGQFVRVRIEGLVRDSALLIPQRAVVPAMGRQTVYTLGAGDTVQSHDVHATAWVGDRWLIDSGLVAGDRVIVDGVQKVRPGIVAKPSPVASGAQ